MPRFIYILVIILSILLPIDVINSEATQVIGFETAVECFQEAQRVSLESYGADEYRKSWNRKFGLLERAIELDSSFTDAYVPYVKTYFLSPMFHEFYDADKLDSLLALLKKGLEQNPPNGGEFYLQMVRIEFSRWGHTKESVARSISYLKEALQKYPESPVKKDIWFSLYNHNMVFGDSAKGIKYLWKIIDLDEKGKTDDYAFYGLIHFYNSELDYSNLMKVTGMYVDRFGDKASSLCYALYCGSLAAHELGLHEKTIQFGTSYYDDCVMKRKGHPQTDRLISGFVKEAEEKLSSLKRQDSD